MLESAERFRLLYDLGCAFSARIELDELMPLVVAKCREVFRAEGCSVLLYDPERNELYFPYTAERDPEVARRLLQMRFPADRGIAGAVLRSGMSVKVDDVRSDTRFYGEIDRNTGATTRNMICAPLRSRRGIFGVIQVINRVGADSFSEDDLAFLEALAGSVGVAIENARLYDEARAAEQRLRTEVGVLRRDLARQDRFGEIVGTAGPMNQVFRLMESAATSPIAVLIEGETGTGKELVARAIHRASARADGPFVAVNCAAVPETLLESQLFGHRRGAFTGALHDQRGLFEAASGGTIFLDEIGEMPPAMQVKLLRVLQEGEITPLGDTASRKVDVRVISATNRALEQEVRERRFREDLYYRLAAFPIRLPPLRERREDIPLLAERFLADAMRRHGKRIEGIDPAAMEALQAFEWPGNVRELQNEIERAVALAREGEWLGLAHFSPRVTGFSPAASDLLAVDPGGPAEPAGLRAARTAFERRYIAASLARRKGNVTHTARDLGISRVMLQKKMKQLGLRETRRRPPASCGSGRTQAEE